MIWLDPLPNAYYQISLYSDGAQGPGFATASSSKLYRLSLPRPRPASAGRRYPASTVFCNRLVEMFRAAATCPAFKVICRRGHAKAQRVEIVSMGETLAKVF